MKKLISLVSLSMLAAAGCNPAEAYCQKVYDCSDELEVDYEDDYPAVCAASLAGGNAALRENAEQECEDLANASAAYYSCLGALECADLKKHFEDGPEADTACKEPGKTLVETTEEADDKCNAIAE
jgi:hypothetical protein